VLPHRCAPEAKRTQRTFAAIATNVSLDAASKIHVAVLQTAFKSVKRIQIVNQLESTVKEDVATIGFVHLRNSAHEVSAKE